GRALGDHQVRAQAADLRENRYYDPTFKVAEDGTFEVKFIRPGKQYIQVDPFWLKADQQAAPTTVLVDLEPGQVLEGVELHAQPSSNHVPRRLFDRTFRVTLLDAEGRPLPDAKFSAASASAPLAWSPLVGTRAELSARLKDHDLGGKTFTTGPDGSVQISG